MNYDAPLTFDFLKSAGVSSVAVASTGTIYSVSMPLPLIGRAQFSLEIQFTSSGTVAADIYIEQSNNLPATESAADANFVIPYNYSSSASIADENVHFIPISPTVSKYIRFKVTGTGSNDASTVISRLILNVAK